MLKQRLILWLSLWLMAPAIAAPIILADQKAFYQLGSSAEFLVDPEWKLTLEDVLDETHQKRFLPVQQTVPNFGFTESAYWLRVPITNRSKRRDWLFEIGWPHIDFIDLFWQTDEGFSHRQSGSQKKFSSREVNYRHFVFFLPIEPEETRWLYLRVGAYGSLQIPMRWWAPADFFTQIAAEQIVLGLFFGVLLALILYNFLLYVSIRDKSTLYYVWFVSSMCLLFAVLNGFGDQYFWPEVPYWGVTLLPLILSGGIVSFLLFSANYLEISQSCSKSYRVLLLLAITACILPLLTPDWLSFGLTIKILTLISVLISILLVLIAIFLIWRDNSAPAWIYLLSFTVLLLGVLIYALTVLGFVSSNFWTTYTIQIGMLLTVLLLSFGLANRMKRTDRQREQVHKELQSAHAEVLRQQLLANENLKKANYLKDEFLANTSHELKTPLNGIIGLTDSLLQGAAGQLSKEVRHHLRLVVSSGRRLSRLITDILEVSRLKNQDVELHQKPLNMCALIDLVLMLSRPLLKKKDVKLLNHLNNDFLPVYGDEDRLQQVMHNLMANAIAFTEQGEITVSAECSNEFMTVCVEDSGVGIKEADLQRIFHSFEHIKANIDRRAGDSTGLGLSISWRLMDLHGGRLWAESDGVSGSRFFLTIPLYRGQEVVGMPQPEAASNLATIQHNLLKDHSLPLEESRRKDEDELQGVEEQQCQLSNMTILVVDDERINRQVLVNILELQGCQVMEAESGEQALSLLKETQPDLIILDVMMPIMNGYTVCQEIRKTWSANVLPILLLTVRSRASDLVEGFSAGANDYLTKPFMTNELLCRINLHHRMSQAHNSTGRFVPHELLALLGKEHIVDLNLGDHAEINCTVLFSDMRDFSKITEPLVPEDTFRFVNMYLGQMGPVVREHNGFIDKYIGDAIMALFLNPEDAVRAAAAMLAVLPEYNSARAKLGRVPIRMGVGIHTGPVMVGTVGEPDRMEGTVLSDVVNTAARLEGLTKQYGEPLLISNTVSDQLGGGFKTELIDQVNVKGKTHKVTVMKVLVLDA